MSSGLRLASSDGKPLDDPEPAIAAAEVADTYLARCPRCDGLNGLSATACWSCEGALTPTEPTHELLMPEGSAMAEPSSSVSLADAPPQPDPERFWDDAPTVPSRPLVDPVPVPTTVDDDFAVSVAHRLHARAAQQRSRRVIAAFASFGLVTVVAVVAYLQLSAPDLPSLQMPSAPSALAAPGQSDVPVTAPEPVSYLPAPPAVVQTAKATPPKAGATRTPSPQRSPRPVSTGVPNTPAVERGADPAPRREACSPTVAALGLCAPPLP